MGCHGCKKIENIREMQEVRAMEDGIVTCYHKALEKKEDSRGGIGLCISVRGANLSPFEAR